MLRRCLGLVLGGSLLGLGACGTTTFTSTWKAYSLDRDEPLWSSTSRTANPKDLGGLVKEVTDTNLRQMAKQGLLARE